MTSVIFNAENCEIMGTSGSPVFKDCNKLSSVTIGENVKSIPDYAFSGCSGLTSVIFNAEKCETMGSRVLRSSMVALNYQVSLLEKM